MQYTLKTLKDLLTQNENRPKAGHSDPLEAMTCSAASFAVGFLECAESSRVPLNFNILDEESIPKVAAVIHLQNIRAGMGIPESREDITKKMTGFELFAILNSFNDEEPNIRMVLPGTLSASPVPVLCTLQKKDQKACTFDVYAAMKKTADSFELGDNYVDDGRFFKGRMLEFHNAFMTFVAETRK